MKTFGVVAAMGGAMGIATAAPATLVTYAFAGTGSGSFVGANSSFSGTLTYETETASYSSAAWGSSNVAYYRPAMTVTFTSGSFTSSGSVSSGNAVGRIELTDSPNATDTLYAVLQSMNNGANGVFIQLNGPSNAWSSTALPSDLSGLTGSKSFYLAGANSQSYSGSISTLAAVPEAATWAMMVGGFGLTGAALRRRRRQAARFA